jgi:hypothetical protein
MMFTDTTFLPKSHQSMKIHPLRFHCLVTPAAALGISCLMLLSSASQAQEQAIATKMLKQLESPDLDSQMDALETLATSLDPRIPDACLPLLKSQGMSIRRKAARAIGSRWQQVPKERVKVFTDALKTNLKSGEPGLVNMSRRGIALLNRTYDNDMFSRSKNRRWVIYERHGKPCLIDTRTHTEELLGFEVEGKFFPAYGNEAIAPFCFWHPKQEMAAMETLIFRRPREIWIWRHGAGLRPIHEKEVMDLLKPTQGEIVPGAGIHMEVARWKGGSLEFKVDYTSRIEEVFVDHSALVRWDSTTDKLMALEDTVDGTRKIE